jgi:hypothetical protein
MAAEGLAALKIGIDIVKVAKELVPSSNKKDLKFYDELCRALRLIYFPPTGMLGLLKDIVAGNVIDEERRTRVMTDFNDYEWKVKETLDGLSFERLENELRLPIVAIQMLHKIRQGKAGLRQAVQEQVNPYGQKGFEIDKARVQELIDRIEQLNSEIEALEAAVNRRAKG